MTVVCYQGTFGIMSCMNFCPPKPGSTVITNTMSTLSTYGRTCSTGVAGLMAMPTYTENMGRDVQLMKWQQQWYSDIQCRCAFYNTGLEKATLLQTSLSLSLYIEAHIHTFMLAALIFSIKPSGSPSHEERVEDTYHIASNCRARLNYYNNLSWFKPKLCFI